MSTFSGSELGCAVALKVLEISQRQETIDLVAANSVRFARGLQRIREAHPDWLTGIRQDGLVIGLEFGEKGGSGAKAAMRALYERGVWAIFSTLDPQVLQFKPGVLLSTAEVDDILGRVEDAVRASAPDWAAVRMVPMLIDWCAIRAGEGHRREMLVPSPRTSV